MKCLRCGENAEETFTTDVFDSGDVVIVIRNIPCFRCETCGEIFFTGKVLKRIEEIVADAKKQPSEISVLRYAA